MRRTTVGDALAWLDAQVAPLVDEVVPLAEAAGRVLAPDVQSQVNVPGFDRAMMDGYAVRAADTLGASSYNRLLLSLEGEALPGLTYAGDIKDGQALRIMTGAAIPTGADAVLPAEQSEIEQDRLYACGEVSPGKHVGRRGEDVRAGTTVLKAGRCLRPQDLGVLSSIGAAKIRVRKRPRVRIVVTGDELLPAGSTPHEHRIADANGPMLESLVVRDGGLTLNPGIVRDEPDAILKALRCQGDEADVVLVSGGSSVGQEDHAPMLLAQHGELAVHGIAMRPSSPAGMGRLENRLVFLLPGNPVSCLCAYDFFAGRAIRALGGRRKDWPHHSTTLPLRRKLVSTIGRVDYARVQVMDGAVEPLAISGASILTSTTRADGFVIVGDDSEGYPAGAQVQVYLYDAVPI